ncbi:MAG TPA: hypothetical protein VE967_14170 [Gemmatimonadaceae bacterium]|nr:hypothetical protein [Gemmatimonadaceae bacterium]
MLRKVMVGLAVAAAVTAAQPAAAQFGAKTTDVGPIIGLGGLGAGAGVSFGGRFEQGIKDLPSLGNGILGIQIGADYWSYGPTGYSWHAFFLEGTANYHFKIKSNDKFDPFVGLGLGYTHVGCGDLPFGISCSASSVDFVGRAGARYYWKPKMALYADIGAGAATINVGLMFKIK